MVSSSKFQPNAEGGASGDSCGGDLHYGKSPSAEEEYPNLSYKLPMKEPRTKKEGIVVVIDDDASCRTGLKELLSPLD